MIDQGEMDVRFNNSKNMLIILIFNFSFLSNKHNVYKGR